jgi:hypothetical protein
MIETTTSHKDKCQTCLYEYKYRKGDKIKWSDNDKYYRHITIFIFCNIQILSAFLYFVDKNKDIAKQFGITDRNYLQIARPYYLLAWIHICSIGIYVNNKIIFKLNKKQLCIYFTFLLKCYRINLLIVSFISYYSIAGWEYTNYISDLFIMTVLHYWIFKGHSDAISYINSKMVDTIEEYTD